MDKNQKKRVPIQSGDYPEVDIIRKLTVPDLKTFSDLTGGSFEVIHRGRRTGFTPTAPAEYFDFERAKTGKIEKYPAMGYYNNGPVFKTRVKNIEVLGGYKKRYAKVGDQIVVTVKKAKAPVGRNSKTKVKKGSVNKAILIRTKKSIKRKDGSSIKFAENATLLLNGQGQPIGTRLIGPVPYELKKYKGVRLASLASGII